MGDVYAARFEVAPGKPGYLLVERQGDALRRVDEVSDWLLAEHSSNRSPNTLKGYAESVVLWWRWCLDRGVHPLRTDGPEFSRWITALTVVPKGVPLSSPLRALPGDDRLRSPGTVRLRVVGVKSFYRWALNNGRGSTATAMAVLSVKTPKAPRKMRAERLQRDGVTSLLSLSLQPRDRLLVEVLYGAGLREGEALGLRTEDLCLNAEIQAIYGCDVTGGPHLHVRRRLNTNGALAKSHVTRTVPLSHRVQRAIRDWHAWAYDNAPDTVDCDYVFVSLSGATRGRPLTVSGFWSMWEDHIQTQPGLADVHPHLLRHTFASELLDAGVSSFVVQELLGHKRPESTQVYTHALAETMVAAVTRLGEWRADNMGERSDT